MSGKAKEAHKKINLTCDVDAIIFQHIRSPNHRIVVGRDDMDYIEFIKRYDSAKYQHTRATGINLEDGDGKFFLVYVSDCFDPPLAVVRAANAGDAEDWFIEELAWADIPEADLKDYNIFPDGDPAGEGKEPKEHAQWTSRGTWADTEQITIHEIKPIYAEID